MRRFWIMLLAVALALVIALPAGAVKPVKPVKPDPKPEGGYTCADYMLLNPDSDWVSFEKVQTDPFELNIVNRQTACVDVIAPRGNWKVEVNEEASGVRRVTIRVQDSVAGGDVCGDNLDPEDDMILGTLGAGEEHWLYDIQGAYVNACGTDWAEWVDGDLLGVEDELVLISKERTDVEHPLAFLVFGGRGTFTIAVTPPGS